MPAEFPGSPDFKGQFSAPLRCAATKFDCRLTGGILRLPDAAKKCLPMPRTLSDHWVTLRPRLTRVQAWLAAREWSRTLTVLLCLMAAVVIVRMVVRKAATGKELADLISALASLAWPIVALAIVSWFRPEIRAILTRIRKGKFLGTEIELLDELQAKTEAAEANPVTISAAAGSASGTGSAAVVSVSAEAAQD